jgi:hypothetical protein
MIQYTKEQRTLSESYHSSSFGKAPACINGHAQRLLRTAGSALSDRIDSGKALGTTAKFSIAGRNKSNRTKFDSIPIVAIWYKGETFDHTFFWRQIFSLPVKLSPDVGRGSETFYQRKYEFAMATSSVFFVAHHHFDEYIGIQLRCSITTRA